MRTIVISSALTINPDLSAYKRYLHKEPYLISITSSIHPYIDEPVEDVLMLTFDDVEESDGVQNAITKADAYDIVDFFHSTEDDALIVVQCDGGVSRSAGVAAALMVLDGQSPDSIFTNPRLSPNKACFNRVIRCAMLEFLKKMDEKFSMNESLYNAYAKTYIY